MLTVNIMKKRWEEDIWGRGVTVVVKSGTLHLYGSGFVRPQGRIHFAGSDSSPVWHGYMEGALFSGERAAAEVAERMRNEEPVEDEDYASEFFFDGDDLQDTEHDQFLTLNEVLDELRVPVKASAVANTVAATETDEARFLAKQHTEEAKEIAKMHNAHHEKIKRARGKGKHKGKKRTAKKRSHLSAL